MDYSNIDSKIDRLNLEWREYDFGETLYAKISANKLLKNTGIDIDCETQKYNIQIQPDGNALIFQEIEQISFVRKIIAMILEVNRVLSKQETKVIESESKSKENSNYQTY